MKQIVFVLIILLISCNSTKSSRVNECINKDGSLIFLQNEVKIIAISKYSLNAIAKFIEVNDFDSFYVDFYFNSCVDFNLCCQRKNNIEKFLKRKILKRSVHISYSYIDSVGLISSGCKDVALVGWGVKRKKEHNYLISSNGLREDRFIANYGRYVRPLDCFN